MWAFHFFSVKFSMAPWLLFLLFPVFPLFPSLPSSFSAFFAFLAFPLKAFQRLEAPLEPSGTYYNLLEHSKAF